MTAPAGGSTNDRTLAAYEAQASRYREQTRHAVSAGAGRLLRGLARLAPPGVVLEIGSAHGRGARALEDLGRVVERTDAAQAFIEMMRADGYSASHLNVLTDEITGSYAAVLADAVFLHFQPGELREVLAKVRAALNPGGVLGFSVKRGDGSEWSSHKLGLPRFFQYWQPKALSEVVVEAGFEIIDLSVEEGGAWDWLVVLATPRAQRSG